MSLDAGPVAFRRRAGRVRIACSCEILRKPYIACHPIHSAADLKLKLLRRMVDEAKDANPYLQSPRVENRDMKSNLESRRRRLLRKLARIERHIVWTQKSMSRIDRRIESLQQARPNAA